MGLLERLWLRSSYGKHILLRCVNRSSYTSRWQRVYENMYKYAMAYEASGVGGSLFDDIQLRIDGDPRTVTFLI